MEMIGKDLKLKFTSDYSLFSKLPMNRDIDSKHVQKMIKSIRMIGVIRPVIIAETNCIEGINKKYIVDGQHLSSALEAEGEPIPYIEIKVTSEEDLIAKMAYLNNSSKSWDLMNYVNAWRMIKPDFAKLFKWKNMYDIEPIMLAAICVNNPSARGASQPLKDGSFKIVNPNAEQMCKDFNDIFIKIGKADRGIKFQFITAFLQAYNGKYDHSKVLANLDHHIKTVKLMSNGNETGEYIRKKIFNLIK